ncbi:MAG TPA: cbb3-type cytochrome c oxidase subunit II [Methylomirabilota bacterium]|nr:cbb3-type cytochrome c oxidase subunit II [Methylomirabilota bacterium]
MRLYALGAGFFFISLAIFVQGLLPIAIPESRETRATRAVRNEAGEITWVWYESSPYSPLERLGRAVYQREGCWYCHSQYVRPVTGEDQRWGPVSEVGEYAHDWPHLLSTRRIGPDLTRVGLKFSDHWHYAHHWSPGMVVPDSIMPAFPWLFRTARVPVVEREGTVALADSPGLKALFSFKAGVSLPLRPSPEGLAFSERTDGTPVLAVSSLPKPYDAPETWKGKTLTVLVPSEELRGLVAYVQKLGTNRGAWRETFEPQALAVSVMSIPQTDDQVARGKAVYERRCVGCHGVKGDGNGPVAAFLDPRPRDFTLGAFKVRTTPSGSLPTDGDLYRTLARGVRWTAMPTWHELPEKDRIAVITYVKTFSARWQEERPEPPIVIGDPPRATPELLARGKELYVKAKCFQCHGEGGKGDGPSADELEDDLKFRIRPTDFTRGQFKGGGDVRDIYRTMTTGLDGTPMPSFADSMKEDERWAISFYVLSFSAFNDPLTGTKLTLDPATKARLNGPDGAAFRHPRLALDPGATPDVAGRPKPLVRFYKGILGEGR